MRTSSYKKKSINEGTVILSFDLPQMPRLCNWRIVSGLGLGKTYRAIEVVLHGLGTLFKRVRKRGDSRVGCSDVRHLKDRYGGGEVEMSQVVQEVRGLLEAREMIGLRFWVLNTGFL